MEVDSRLAVPQTPPVAVVATDGELLMRFERHRDEQAFAEVVERHGRLVWIVCQQTLRHHQDVEDAFQATFLILARKATTIRASDSAAAWLYRVAQRTAVAARRQRDQRREEPLAVEPPQGDDALPVIHDRQMIYVLMEELRALPERYQTPLVLRYFEGQSRRAIAEQTDSTLAQVQGRLVRGRRMLRSRLIRRGVSLSLAAGAVATASGTASAAVSPSFVAATAASSTVFITSGVSGAASPVSLELAKQGVTAMWYASLGKAAAVSATLLIGLGVAYAAGQPGEGGGGLAAVQVDLGESAALAAADNGNEEVAAVEIAAPNDAPQPEGNNEEVLRVVSEVSSAKRQFELERDHWLLKAKAYRLKAKRLNAVAASGQASPDTAIDAMLMEADANLAEAKSIELDQRMANPDPAADQLEEQRLKELEQQKAENEAEIDELESILEKIRPSVATEAAKVEFEQIERAMLQRELEQLHAVLMQLNQSEAVKSSGESGDLLQQKLRRKDEVSKQLTMTLEKLTATMKQVADASAKFEGAKRKQHSYERQLEHLEQRRLQLEFPQAVTTEPSLEERRLQAMVVHLQNQLASRSPARATSDAGATIVVPGETRLTAGGMYLEAPRQLEQSAELRQTKASMAKLEAQLATMSGQIASLQAENAELKEQSNTTLKPSPEYGRYIPVEGTQNSYGSVRYLEGEGDGGDNHRESQQNLKRLGRSFLDYHNAHNRFPSNKHAPGGEPLLSWRVHLLPFLGYDELYRKFKFDEPWDGPHNKTLISEMPEVFADSNLRESGKTAYLAPIGRGYLFDVSRRPAALRDIIDGTANTISLVEAAPEKAVIWTKPDDLAIDAHDPLSGLGESRLALFVSGDVRVIPRNIDRATFNALLTRGGREPLDREAIFGK